MFKSKSEPSKQKPDTHKLRYEKKKSEPGYQELMEAKKLKDETRASNYSHRLRFKSGISKPKPTRGSSSRPNPKHTK